MKKYFLSYSRGDQAFTLRFANDLKAAGVDVWVDQFDIAIGQNWDRSVEAAVRACDGFIIIMSPRSVASENVADEIGVALEGGKHIIPILHEKCTVPMRLARVQFIDATTDYQGALQRCLSIVQAAGAIGSPTSVQHTAPPAPAAAAPSFSLPGDAAEKLSEILTGYLGLVGRHVVSSELRQANSRDDLYQRLAAHIPGDKERAELLKKLRSQ